MGHHTLYSYRIFQALFSVWTKSTGDALNVTVALSTIRHLTGARTEFEYEPVQKNLGASGLQTSRRVVSRMDMIGDDIYNHKTYSYSANNNSGWPPP
jgi:hypothetical protein